MRANCRLIPDGTYTSTAYVDSDGVVIDLCVASDRQLSFAAAKLLDYIDRFMRDEASRPL